MFGFIKKAFFKGFFTILSSVNQLNAISLNAASFKCISMTTNHGSKVGPQIVSVNNDELVMMNTCQELMKQDT